MAQFTRTHGDAQPVFAMDTLNGPVASTTNAAGTTTNFMGPGMQFFGMDLGAAPTTQLGVSGAISAVLQCLEQQATVMIYSVAATTNVTNMSVASYPLDGWTAATLQVAIRALGTVNGYDLSGATVTDVGFRLASTATSAS
jgi:hypothetical protein